MIKTQIQLEESQHEALKALGVQAHASMSELVRRAVNAFLASSRAAPMPGLDEIAGKYRPRSMEDLKAHDAQWAASIR